MRTQPGESGGIGGIGDGDNGGDGGDSGGGEGGRGRFDGGGGLGRLISVETAVGAEAGGELTAEWMAVGARVAPLVEPRAAARAVLLMAVAFSVRAQP